MRIAPPRLRPRPRSPGSAFFFFILYHALDGRTALHALILIIRRDAGTLPWHALTFRPSMLMEHVAQSPCLQLYFTYHGGAW